MEIITSPIAIVFALIAINAVFDYLGRKNTKKIKELLKEQSDLLNKKDKLLNLKIEELKNLNIPVLIIMRDYFVDREDFVSAQRCKDVLEETAINKSK